MLNLNACTRLASVTSQGTPPRNILFEKDGLRRVFGGRCPDQVLGGVSTSSASSSDVGGGRAAGGALQLSLGGSGGRVVEGGGGVGGGVDERLGLGQLRSAAQHGAAPLEAEL